MRQKQETIVSIGKREPILLNLMRMGLNELKEETGAGDLLIFWCVVAVAN